MYCMFHYNKQKHDACISQAVGRSLVLYVPFSMSCFIKLLPHHQCCFTITSTVNAQTFGGQNPKSSASSFMQLMRLMKYLSKHAAEHTQKPRKTVIVHNCHNLPGMRLTFQKI